MGRRNARVAAARSALIASRTSAASGRIARAARARSASVAGRTTNVPCGEYRWQSDLCLYGWGPCSLPGVLGGAWIAYEQTFGMVPQHALAHGSVEQVPSMLASVSGAEA